MLREITFQYNGTYVDYGYSYDCDLYGCEDEGICRCGTIDGEKVKSVDIPMMAEKIYDEFFERGKAADRNNAINQVLYGIGKEIDIYAIDRILRSYKIWENDNWDIEIIGESVFFRASDRMIMELRNKAISLHPPISGWQFMKKMGNNIL